MCMLYVLKIYLLKNTAFRCLKSRSRHFPIDRNSIVREERVKRQETREENSDADLDQFTKADRLKCAFSRLSRRVLYDKRGTLRGM